MLRSGDRFFTTWLVVPPSVRAGIPTETGTFRRFRVASPTGRCSVRSGLLALTPPLTACCRPFASSRDTIRRWTESGLWSVEAAPIGWMLLKVPDSEPDAPDAGGGEDSKQRISPLPFDKLRIEGFEIHDPSGRIRTVVVLIVGSHHRRTWSAGAFPELGCTCEGAPSLVPARRSW